MKLSCLFIMVSCLQVSARTYSQEKFTLSFNDVKLEKALKEIEKKSDFRFVYSNNFISKQSKVSLSVKDASLNEVLDLMLKNTGLTYLFPDAGKLVVISNADENIKLATIKGRVVDMNRTPMKGVSVYVKGNATIGTTTDENGNFQLSVPDNVTTLVFSYVGFQLQEINIQGKNQVDIVMTPSYSQQDEVVVIGYGTQSKRNLASATSRVSGNEFKSSVINTVDQGLQGRVTGVTIHEVSGEPGASSIIRVRGSNSLSGNNEPLYVIDGFAMPSFTEARASAQGVSPQNGLYGINPNDIESIEVLKDASATAIYGSRGANGVIVITTKSGKRGEGKIELVNKTSFGTIDKPLKMMTGRQSAEIYNEYSVKAGLPQPFGNLDTIKTNTNWFDAISRPSSREDVSLNVSGGGPKSTYYISGNYLKDRGLIIGSEINRGSLRANLNSEVNSWYSIKSQLSLVHQLSDRGVSSNGAFPDGTGLLIAFRTSPLYKLTDGDGTNNTPSVIPGNAPSFFANPVKGQTDRIDITQNDYSIVNIENIFQIAPGLKMEIILGRAQNLSRKQFFAPVTVSEGHQINGTATSSEANTYSYNVVSYLNYYKNFEDKHNISLTLGTEYNNEQLEMLSGVTSGYDINAFGANNLSSASAQQTFSYKQKRVIQSAFLRGNYTFKDKYVLNTSIRADQASPFAANKKTGYFPSVAVGWNINNEDFMKNVTIISNSKIRASYGVTGSQAIAPYSSLSTYTTSFYNGSLIVYPGSIGNADLSWEKTKQFDAGFDFSALNNRLNFSFDYYNKKTDGLLQPHQLPSQSGTSSILDNFGVVSNKGIEFSIQANIIREKNFQFSTRFNISKNKNVLLNLGDVKTSQYQLLYGNLQSGVYSILTPGQELGQFYGYKINGLAQEKDFTNGVPNYPFPGNPAYQIPGVWKYEDVNKDGKITQDDRQVLGKSTPDFTYGWTNDFSYKKLSLSLFFTGSAGNQILNMTRHYLANGLIQQPIFGFFNQTEDWYKNRWTPSNPTNNVRYPGTQISYFETGGDITSAEIENGSYFRLKQVTLAYDFPSFKAVKNLRLFATGTNIFTITKYSGFDPEASSSYGQTGLRQGVDWANYPTQHSYTIGLSCNF